MTIVRQATADDAQAIRETARESWHAAYDSFLGSETVEAVIDDWYAVDGLEASIDDAADRSDVAFLVAEATGGGERDLETPSDVVGFVHVVPSRDDRCVASLRRLYVRPDDWGTGIGTTLTERAVTALQDADETEYDRLRLEVFAENEVGVRFYESRGFDRVGEHAEEFAGANHRVYTYEKSFGPDLK